MGSDFPAAHTVALLPGTAIYIVDSTSSSTASHCSSTVAWAYFPGSTQCNVRQKRFVLMNLALKLKRSLTVIATSWNRER